MKKRLLKKMKTIVCLILILYVTNVCSFEITSNNRICVNPNEEKDHLCEKIKIEYKDVVIDCQHKFNSLSLRGTASCSNLFNDDSDYVVKEYHMTHAPGGPYLYHFIPSMNYGKYMSKQAVEECEKKGNIQLPASLDPPSWTNTSCHTYFYRLKSEHEINECQKAWRVWKQMNMKGYLTEEYRNGNFLGMVKEQFHDNLVAIHSYAFEFQFDELSHNLLCVPDDDYEPLCRSFFKLCNNEDQEKGEHQWKDIKPNGIHTVPGHEWYYQKPSDLFGDGPIHIQSTSDVKESQEETKHTKRGINLSPLWTDPEEENPNDGRIFRCSNKCEEEKEEEKSACDDYCNEKNPHPEARLFCAAFCDSTIPLQPSQEEKKSISEPSRPQEQSTTDSVCLGGVCSAYEVRRADPSHMCYHDDFCSGSGNCYVNGKPEQQKEKTSNDDHPGFLKAADGTIGNYCKFEYPSYQPLSCWNVSHATPGQGHDAWSVGDILHQKSSDDFEKGKSLIMSFLVLGMVFIILYAIVNMSIHCVVWFMGYVIINGLRYSYNEIRLFMNYVHDYISGNFHTYRDVYEHRISQLSDLINDILTQQTEFELSIPDKETK